MESIIKMKKKKNISKNQKFIKKYLLVVLNTTEINFYIFFILQNTINTFFLNYRKFLNIKL